MLHQELLNGKKIHGLFGSVLFKLSYEEILATDGLAGDKNLYGRSKNGVFAMLYGGESYTLQTRVGVSAEVADAAYHDWCQKYKVWGECRKAIFNDFCSMRQPGGIGSKVEWHDPKDYAESLLGFRRYFTLENRVCKALFDMGEHLPERFHKFKGKVVRRDREQTQSGALRSALFAAAFAIQASNMRAAANHVIQSTGGQLTKSLQARLWGIQPNGIGRWRIIPMNIHDEVMAPIIPSVRESVTGIVTAFVEEHKPLVPLLGITWKTNLDSWAGKH
jgi:DNA polymerase I-like protein with 3'-5' exonuclease and polymerase domains